MATMNPEASSEAVAALARLAQVLDRPDGRESFVADPVAALRQSDIAEDAVPRGLLDFLRSLSPEELEILSRHCQELVRSGYFVSVPGIGKLCFF
jgi:hypothetical protein